MKKFYSLVVKNRIVIIIAFLIATLVSLGMKKLVQVNYDINEYLPEGTHSSVSLEVMSEEFGGGIPNARIMLKNVTIPEALEYKSQIAAVDGVIEVSWLDDSVDVTLPMSMMDQAALETYYKDHNALMNVTLDKSKQIGAVDEIKAIIGEDNAMIGSAVSTAHSTVNTVKEVAKITACAIIFSLIVLIFSTKSWVEPIVILGGLGVAVALNGGTNLIFGTISFVTSAAGSILQLAVSMDYSVFLIHRFEECREKIENVEEAMVEALCKSTSSILSSGLTTVIGFLALALMKFEIGPDLGYALAKGIGISLITVFLFVPCIVLMTYKLMDRTHHRSLMPGFAGLGKLVCRVIVPMAIVFAVLVVPSYLASNANSYYYGSSFILGEDTEFGQDTIAIEGIFGKNDTYVLLVPKGNTALETELSNDLHKLPQITSLISYVDKAGAEIPKSYLDEKTLALLESENYSRMVLSVDIPYEGAETFELIEKIKEIANKHYPDTYYLAGVGVSTYDLMETVTEDMVKVNLLAIAAVFVVLLLTMKSIWLPIILVLSIELAIWINMAVPYFMDTPIFYLAYLIISSIQLGATVDYAILLTDRYKENREILDRKETVIQTIADTTLSILTSGIALTAVGFAMGYFASNQLLAQLGVFLGRGTLLSVCIVLFVLPGLLYLFDPLFIKNGKKMEVQE